MTWNEYIEKRAKELAYCNEKNIFDKKISEIKQDLRSYNNVPGDFWSKLNKTYASLPKTRRMRKDATTATELFDYDAYADQVLLQLAEN